MSYEDKIKKVLTDSETYMGENHDLAAALGFEADEEIRTLKAQMSSLAKLAADTPQFSNPIHAMAAKNLRDEILNN